MVLGTPRSDSSGSSRTDRIRKSSSRCVVVVLVVVVAFVVVVKVVVILIGFVVSVCLCVWVLCV